MAEVEYRLTHAITLNQILPAGAGVAVGLPADFPNAEGLYLILNQNGMQENRYMGISNDIRDRFAGRQGACYELGFEQAVLNGIYAFIGTMRYRDNGAVGWNNAPGYVAGNLQITLDGHNYDLEHILIKAAQHIWPYGTISNTQKTGALINAGAYPINIDISWNNAGVGAVQNQNIVIPIAGQLA